MRNEKTENTKVSLGWLIIALLALLAFFSAVGKAQSVRKIESVGFTVSDMDRAIDFYTRVLGLRLVKVTVNFDDPNAYHFYYGDTSGAPGTILTFFVWPMGHRVRVGRGGVSATAFSVPLDSLDWWRERLEREGIQIGEFSPRFGEKGLAFSDPDGMILELIETPAPAIANVWKGATIPEKAAIWGFHGVSIFANGIEPTANVLTETLGFEKIGIENGRARFGGKSEIGRFVDVIFAPELPRAGQGTGAVHHIAFRAQDDDSQLRFRAELVRGGANVSPVMERDYFRSIYFREPGGVLFEIATDAPGFAIDEPLENLGGALQLPAQFRAHREKIEANLPRVVLPNGGEIGV